MEDEAIAVSRAAKETECPACGAPVLKGLDDDVAAFEVMADREPIGEPLHLNETVAILSGLATFNRNRGTGRNPRWELTRRTVRIIGPPLYRYPVHVEHRCYIKREERA